MIVLFCTLTSNVIDLFLPDFSSLTLEDILCWFNTPSICNNPERVSLQLCCSNFTPYFALNKSYSETASETGILFNFSILWKISLNDGILARGGIIILCSCST